MYWPDVLKSIGIKVGIITTIIVAIWAIAEAIILLSFYFGG
jgi:hypothetical protein